MNNQAPIVLRCEQVSKTFQQGKLIVPVLQDINFTLRRGESVAIMGASGSGKSTLLHLLGGLDHPTQGTVWLLEQTLFGLSQAKLSQLRNQALGFVYQFHHLLPEFSALENVAMPLLIRGTAKEQAYATGADMLKQVGLSHRLQHKPGELSGGERQRTAMARALVTQPACLLADEPTGNLDRQTATAVFSLMLELQSVLGTAMIIVTHDEHLAGQMATQYQLVDGWLSQTS